ncbi:MAG: hypothetical protein NZ585_01310 [Chloracidobacterium sp.]|nr:hypothetical protein [Chloracidobacterium sp.]MDW8216356.1 hypothetical protein [Acidobacteriota bacterium]
MLAVSSNHAKTIELVYQILCDDVRLEVGNKLSFMGVFQEIYAPEIPFGLVRMAVCNHWRGTGEYLSEVRILSPGRREALAVSTPSRLSLPAQGFNTNVTFFLNLHFPQAGEYVVQTLLDSRLFCETILRVGRLTPPSDHHPNPLLN